MDLYLKNKSTVYHPNERNLQHYHNDNIKIPRLPVDYKSPSQYDAFQEQQKLGDAINKPNSRQPLPAAAAAAAENNQSSQASPTHRRAETQSDDPFIAE